ncbi:MAG TPA: DegT/DnrJ/EryC1/StrS family aminotransferase [Candidatus Hydrogenedentes bacterium]|nr:DegT/DnrJ/EryC1/StrS family aminotransferase [Candidatus Hydrogenedentota bacterium]
MNKISTPFDLASNGDPAAFAEPLHVGRPNVGDRRKLMARIEGILDRNWLSNHGPLVQEFEAKLAAYLGVKHCIPICNGTVALELAIRALDLKGEVILPAFTFVATAHSLQWQGITPIFADIDPATHNLDPAAVERMITPRTTGIIGVHVWGRPCAIEALQAVADQHGLPLMFDAAHAFGCSHGGRMIGNFGRCEVFSFHATKFFNTFEGGAIATNDDELAAKIRLMKNFGFKGFDNVVYLGVNGKMTEVCAAMGLTGLESLNEFMAVNRRNYEAYRQGLAGIPGLRLIEYSPTEPCNRQYIVAEVDERAYGRSRDAAIQMLHAENVLARKYFWPGCHRMEPYRTLYPEAGRNLPRTEEVAARVIVLPTGKAVDVATISIICGMLVPAHGACAQPGPGRKSSCGSTS